jgi:integrase
MLTTVQLRSIKPQDKKTKIYDKGGLAGLYVEVSPKAKITFRLKYRFEGKEYSFNLGNFPAISITEARTKGLEAKEKIAKGIDPNQEKIKLAAQIEVSNTRKQFSNLIKVIDTYIAKESITHKGHRWNEIRLEKIKRDFPLLCSKPIDEIEPLDIIQWRDQRLKQVSPASVHRESNLISSVFTYAVQELRLIKHNPVRDVKKPRKSKPRDRRISAEEIDIICQACSYKKGTTPVTKTQMVAWCFLFAIETAMRAGEITGLMWEHVYADHVHLPDTKNDSSRNVPLSDAALALIELMRGIDDERVVIIDSPSLSSLFREKRDSTSLKDSDLRFHDTRHEACTRLAQILPIQDLAKVSGHRDLKVLLNTYYNITASEIATKIRTGQKS